MPSLTLPELSDHIQDQVPIEAAWMAHGELTLQIQPEVLIKVLRFVRDNPRCQFRCLLDICGVDYPGRMARFEVVYHLLSLEHNHRLRIKVPVVEGRPVVPSVVELFPAAGWWEREAWDMYGIQFKGNPDLRRILTDYDFEGHPLRKDFPLTGFTEVRYDADLGKVVHEPVVLEQAYRTFDTLSPWEGHVLRGDEKGTCDTIPEGQDTPQCPAAGDGHA